VPRNSGDLEKLLRILVLVMLLRQLRPDLSAVGLGNLAELAGGSLRIRPLRRGEVRAVPLPSSSETEAGVVTALEAVIAEPAASLQGTVPLDQLLGGGTRPAPAGDVVDFLRAGFTAKGFKVEEVFEPVEIAPRSVPRLVKDIAKSERSREIACVLAAPFLTKAAFLPNPIVKGGALLGLAACGLEVLEP